MRAADLSQLGEWTYVDYRLLSWTANTVGACYHFSERVKLLIEQLLEEIRIGGVLLVDFSQVDDLSWEQGFLRPINFESKGKKLLCFFGLGPHLYTLFSSHSNGSGFPFGSPKEYSGSIYWGGAYETLRISLSELPGVVKSLQENESKSVEDLVLSSFEPFRDNQGRQEMKLLPNTPVLCNGMFNAQRLIECSTYFIRVTLALARSYTRMQAKVRALMTDNHCTSIRFLGLSLRASPFVGALSVLVPEHGFNIFAPGTSSRLLSESVSNPLLPRVAYVFVADFLVGGLELRVAESFAAHRHSVIAGCVCLGTFLDPNIYRKTAEVSPLVVLWRKDSMLKFEIAKQIPS